MKIRYTDTAADEIDEIFDYIAERDRSAALRVVARVRQIIGMLADFPDVAQMSDEPGVRRIPVGRYPFLIFYTVDENEVVILHVRHAARQWPWSNTEN
jgi:plasmid stabilization system protein ParE